MHYCAEQRLAKLARQVRASPANRDRQTTGGNGPQSSGTASRARPAKYRRFIPSKARKKKHLALQRLLQDMGNGAGFSSMDW